MPLSAEDLVSNSIFPTAVIRCATELIEIYRENPRMASVFAARQRWLMAQAGIALYHGHPDGLQAALYSERFVEFVVEHRIASRNTAAAFMREMLTYRFLRLVPDLANRRTRLVEPTSMAKDHIWRWLHLHLQVLDHLDGKDRSDRLSADPSAFEHIQPRIALRILSSTSIRNPGETFDIFNSANSGGVVMDYLISQIDSLDQTAEKVLIGRISLREIHQQFLISNTHLKRLVSHASKLGSLGWTEAPGRSSMWLSRGFIAEYLHYQAEKFAIIDAAAEAVFTEREAIEAAAQKQAS